MLIRNKFGVNNLLARGHSILHAVEHWNANPNDEYSLQLKHVDNTCPVKTGVSTDGWQNGFGNLSNASLERIDWAFEEMWKMGIQWYRDWFEPDHYWRWEAMDGAKIDPNDNDGWEAIDRIIQNGRKYGIQIIMAGGSGYNPLFGAAFFGGNDPVKFRNNFVIPQLEYCADRYKGYEDVLSIDPVNEVPWVLGWHSVARVPASVWADFQIGVYDAVKAVNPNMRVNLASCNGSWTELNMMIDAMAAKNAMGKFDEYALVHLYPSESDVANAGSYTGAGVISDSQVLTTRNKLVAGGRSDVLIGIDEFGIFWDDTPAHEQLSANTLTEMYNFCRDNPYIGRCLYWRFWGSTRSQANFSGLYAAQNAGLVLEDTKGYTLPGLAVQNLNLEQYVLDSESKIFFYTSGEPVLLGTGIMGASTLPVNMPDWYGTIQLDTYRQVKFVENLVLDTLREVYRNATVTIEFDTMRSVHELKTTHLDTLRVVAFKGTEHVSLDTLREVKEKLYEVLTFTGELLPGQVLTIDMKDMTAEVNGQNVLHQIDGDFFILLPGENELKYQDSSSSRNVALEITKRSKFV